MSKHGLYVQSNKGRKQSTKAKLNKSYEDLRVDMTQSYQLQDSATPIQKEEPRLATQTQSNSSSYSTLQLDQDLYKGVLPKYPDNLHYKILIYNHMKFNKRIPKITINRKSSLKALQKNFKQKMKKNGQISSKRFYKTTTKFNQESFDEYQLNDKDVENVKFSLSPAVQKGGSIYDSPLPNIDSTTTKFNQLMKDPKQTKMLTKYKSYNEIDVYDQANSKVSSDKFQSSTNLIINLKTKFSDKGIKNRLRKQTSIIDISPYTKQGSVLKSKFIQKLSDADRVDEESQFNIIRKPSVKTNPSHEIYINLSQMLENALVKMQQITRQVNSDNPQQKTKSPNKTVFNQVTNLQRQQIYRVMNAKMTKNTFRSQLKKRFSEHTVEAVWSLFEETIKNIQSKMSNFYLQDVMMFLINHLKKPACERMKLSFNVLDVDKDGWISVFDGIQFMTRIEDTDHLFWLSFAKLFRVESFKHNEDLGKPKIMPIVSRSNKARFIRNKFKGNSRSRTGNKLQGTSQAPSNPYSSDSATNTRPKAGSQDPPLKRLKSFTSEPQYSSIYEMIYQKHGPAYEKQKSEQPKPLKSNKYDLPSEEQHKSDIHMMRQGFLKYMSDKYFPITDQSININKFSKTQTSLYSFGQIIELSIYVTLIDMFKIPEFIGEVSKSRIIDIVGDKKYFKVLEKQLFKKQLNEDEVIQKLRQQTSWVTKEPRDVIKEMEQFREEIQEAQNSSGLQFCHFCSQKEKSRWLK